MGTPSTYFHAFPLIASSRTQTSSSRVGGSAVSFLQSFHLYFTTSLSVTPESDAIFQIPIPVSPSHLGFSGAGRGCSPALSVGSPLFSKNCGLICHKKAIRRRISPPHKTALRVCERACLTCLTDWYLLSGSSLVHLRMILLYICFFALSPSSCPSVTPRA